MERAAKLTVDDLGVVQEELYGARTHWYNMGLKLELKVDTLDTIRPTCSGDPSECFREMLKRYLQRVTPVPSWRALVEALRSPIVDQPWLAEKVEHKYCCVLNTQLPELQESQLSLPHTEEISMPLYMPLSHVSEKSPETSTEDELHGLALRIPTSGEVSADEEQQPKDFGCGCGKCSFHSFLEKGCPEPILSMSSFPYLNTVGLNHSQKQILRGKLYHEFEVITTDFGSLVYSTCESLIQQGVTVQQLVLLLMTLDAFQPTLPSRPLLEEHIEELKTADSIYDVFFILRGYISFFSYHIIDYIIRKFGTAKDKESLQNYTTKLDEYSRRSVFECPTYSLERKDQANLVVKVEGVNLEKYTAKHLEVFQSRVSNIVKVSKYTLRLCTVEQGCLQLTFQMPHFVKEVIFSLSESQKTALQTEGVTLIICDDYRCQFKEVSLSEEPSVLGKQSLSNITQLQFMSPEQPSHPHPPQDSLTVSSCPPNQQITLSQLPTATECQISSTMSQGATSSFTAQSNASFECEHGQYIDLGDKSLTEEQLVSLTARELNLLCQDLPEDFIKQLKKYRRRLKSRVSADHARVRRVTQTRMREERDDLKEQLQQMSDRCRLLQRGLEQMKKTLVDKLASPSEDPSVSQFHPPQGPQTASLCPPNQQQLALPQQPPTPAVECQVSMTESKEVTSLQSTASFECKHSKDIDLGKGLTEEQLVSITARELNQLCQDLPEDVVKELKKRRRTLRNRRLAYNSRVRRVTQNNVLEKECDDLKMQLHQMFNRCTLLEKERNVLRSLMVSAGVSLSEEPSVSGEQLVSNTTQQQSPEEKTLTDTIPESEKHYQLPPQFYYPPRGPPMTSPYHPSQQITHSKPLTPAAHSGVLGPASNPSSTLLLPLFMTELDGIMEEAEYQVSSPASQDAVSVQSNTSFECEHAQDIDLGDINLKGPTREAVSKPYRGTSPKETSKDTYTVPDFEINYQLLPTHADKTTSEYVSNEMF